MKKRLLSALLCLCLLVTLLPAMMIPASAANTGDTFTAKNSDGVTIKYKVLADTSKVEVITNNYSGMVNIPSSVSDGTDTYTVTTIGDSAFKGCYNMTTVTIPNSVTAIGTSAFSDCNQLTGVAIPNSVTAIGSKAFWYCLGLKSMAIPDSITAISDEVFFCCTGLTSVTIPDGVTSIGQKAFGYCTKLASVTIPDSITSIGENAFLGCSGFNSITIPNSVTFIGDCAFSYCSGLTSVTIPDSVTSIGNGVFSYCTGLTSMTIPDSVTSIGVAAFSECTGLTSVTIPNSVTSISASAFSFCKGLTSVTIPNSVTTIGEQAFYSCTGLTSVTIPDSVTVINGLAFYNCTNLDALVFKNAISAPTLDDSITDQPLTVYYPAAAESSYTTQSGLPAKRVSYDDSTALFTHFYLGGVRGAIYETAKTITVDLGVGATLTGLTVDAGYIGSSMTPTGAQDFSALSRVYTVTPASGSPVAYTVNIYSRPSVSGSNTLAGSVGNIGEKTISATIADSFPEEIKLTASVGGKTATASRTGDGSVTFTFLATDLNALSAGSYNITISAAATASNQAVASTNVGVLTVLPAPQSSGYSPAYNTISASAGKGGSISPSGSSSVAYGNDMTYAITADKGYKIEDVLVDGVPVGSVSAYTFKNVSTSHTIIATFKKTETLNPFTDINKNDWFYDNVMYVYENGLMTGTGSDAFSPKGTTTRGMIVTVLYRLSGDKGSNANSFSDVPSGSWYENAAAWAAANGIVGGIGSNQFAPDGSLTREQLAVMLYNYAKYKRLNVSVGENTNILSYNDATSISDYACAALQWACAAGIIKGDGGNLKPQNTATRAEVAAMLERFIEKTIG